MDAFRKNPAVRFWARTLVVAIVGYAVAALREGEIADWHAFGWGLATAAGTALVGLLTPVEPFVGAFKVPVEVPADKATIVRPDA